MPATHSPDDYILVVCSTCHARLHPRWDQAGKKLICPDCGKKLLIPWPKRRKEERQPKPEDIGEYGVGAAIKPAATPTPYLDMQALAYARSEPEPPRWTFFSGVFEFPWYPGTISRWIYLSLGLLAIGEITAVSWLFSGIGAKGVIFFGIVLIWLGVWTFSYAAACCLAVVQDTAAGNDQIVSWPEPDWREWVLRLFYTGYIVALVLAPSYGIGLLVEPCTGLFWPAMLATSFFLFPIVLLSSMEANSPWVPLSLAVLRSLFTLCWGWAVFYIQAAVLTAMFTGLLFVGVVQYPFQNHSAALAACTILLAAPVLAALLLIYARLLGRLGWRATRD